jgi:hypothetical protein
MQYLNDSLEKLLVEQARSRDENDRTWGGLCRNYLQMKNEAGYSLLNDFLKRGKFDFGGEWKALTLETLAVPLTFSDSGRVIGRQLLAQEVQIGSVVGVESRYIKYNLETLPKAVRDCLRASLKKHGRDKTIETFELAVELGWFNEADAEYWLDQLREQPKFILPEENAVSMPKL